MNTLLVFTACPNEEVATELARNLVHHKLAACINIIPKVHSIYRWHDAVEESKEILLMIKTTKASYSELEEQILKQHPYEVPEIIAIEMEKGSQAYTNWLIQSCGEAAVGK